MPVVIRAGPDELTVTEASAEFGYPARTLISWCRAGRLQARQIGPAANAAWLIQRSALASFKPPKRGPARQISPSTSPPNNPAFCHPAREAIADQKCRQCYDRDRRLADRMFRELERKHTPNKPAK